MTLEVSVRPIRPDDLATWTPLRDGYNAFYGRSGPTALAPEFRLYWQTHETNAAGRRLYDQVATHSGFIVYARQP